MDVKTHSELKSILTDFLVEKRLRKSKERYTILEYICSFPGHFELPTLHDKLEENNFHVSKATLYNNLDLMVEAGLIVRHQLSPIAVQYELRSLAETHHHLICSKCGTIREVRNTKLRDYAQTFKPRRFTPSYYCLLIYGICSKCTFQLKQMKKAREREEKERVKKEKR